MQTGEGLVPLFGINGFKQLNGFYRNGVFDMIDIYVFKERKSENGSERYKAWKID
jgi:hypothetical protein